MKKTVRSFNRTLRTESPKRRAERLAGTWKPKPRKPLARVSVKTKKRIAKYREDCFSFWGCSCFLCGREYEPNEHGNIIGLEAHHALLRKNGDNPIVVFPVCSRNCGCRGHNHTSKDRRFWELNDKIITRLSAQQKQMFDTQWNSVYNEDYETSKRTWYERNLGNNTL